MGDGLKLGSLFWSTWLLVTCSNVLLGQPGGDIQKQVEELRSRVKSLEKENLALRSGKRSADSISYCILRLEIFDAFVNESQLLFDFRNTVDKISVTGLFTRLMQANNPTSDILGFQFAEIIITAAEKYFKNQLESEPDRHRFSSIISKIIGNPVISTLAGSNPLTSIVSALVTSIIGFTTTSVNKEKDSGRDKDIGINQKDAFDPGSISAFREEMQVYIDFYDKLIQASDEYLEGLDNLESKYNYLMNSVNGYLLELHYHFSSAGKNQVVALATLFPDPANPGVPFESIMQNEEILQISSITKRFTTLRTQVDNFKNEYNSLLCKFLREYIRILRSAVELPDKSVDLDRIEALVKDIESFIDNQELDRTSYPGVF